MADGLAQPINSNNFLQPMQTNIPSVGFNPAAGGGDGLAFQQPSLPNIPGIDVPGAGAGGFDWGNAMSNFSMGAEGILGLASAYNAYKQQGIMEDQFDLQKNLANRNIANTAKTTNRMLDDRADLAAQISGAGTEQGTAEHIAAKKKLQTTVDGSPVG